MKKISKRHAAFTLTLIIAVLFCGTLYAQERTGDIEVVAEGLAGNKQDALLAAKRAAVEQGIGIVIITETEVKNFMVEKDKILTNTMGSVKKYEVLKEGKTADSLYEVQIKAVVSLANISRDLAALQILLESMDKPRTMILIDEKIDGSRTKYCETAIADKLLEYKFNLVDPAMTAGLLNKGDDIIEKACAGNKLAAVKIGKANGAEVIIAGNVKVSKGTPVFGLESGQADVSVQAVLCSSGKIIASKNIHGAAAHVSDKTAMAEAVKKAALKVIENKKQGRSVTSLFDKIVGSWQDMANNGIQIKLSVQNVANFKAFKAVKTLVKDLGSSVVSVTQRGWAKPNLDLDVLYKGSVEDLCEKLDGRAVPGAGTLSVNDFTAGSIAAEIK